MLGAVLVLVFIAIAFVYAQVEIAVRSIQFDLHLIGESVYEARTKNGRWPARTEELEGTAYLALPHRRAMLEDKVFIVVFNQELASDPKDNGHRVLAYDNRSLLSRLGRVWVCRGDLSVDYVKTEELQRLSKANKH